MRAVTSISIFIAACARPTCILVWLTILVGIVVVAGFLLALLDRLFAS